MQVCGCVCKINVNDSDKLIKDLFATPDHKLHFVQVVLVGYQIDQYYHNMESVSLRVENPSLPCSSPSADRSVHIGNQPQRTQSNPQQMQISMMQWQSFHLDSVLFD